MINLHRSKQCKQASNDPPVRVACCVLALPLGSGVRLQAFRQRDSHTRFDCYDSLTSHVCRVSLASCFRDLGVIFLLPFSKSEFDIDGAGFWPSTTMKR
jgi:hypothetical protein